MTIHYMHGLLRHHAESTDRINQLTCTVGQPGMLLGRSQRQINQLTCTWHQLIEVGSLLRKQHFVLRLRVESGWGLGWLSQYVALPRVGLCVCPCHVVGSAFMMTIHYMHGLLRHHAESTDRINQLTCTVRQPGMLRGRSQRQTATDDDGMSHAWLT